MISVELAGALVIGAGRARVGLTVLYDERCPLCRRLRAWLGSQPTLEPLTFLPAGSADARARFPGLDHERTTRVLTVVTADGAVFEEERAWVLCAWALPRWRPVSEQLGTRWRLRLVRVAARVVDGYRHRRLAHAGGCGACGGAA
ncbi:MAG TPA: DCC1-like thiol-disulfide oxidoreductase family protein [Acidimicrobiales bacterium]|nr:DCC1-like thiol-disulfide oxidoreductase family protein [Acidimicrobiales bacterium]